MEDHFKFFNSEMTTLLAENEKLKQQIAESKPIEKLQEVKHEESKYKIECQELTCKLFKLANIHSEIPMLKSQKIELSKSCEALEQELKTNLENLQLKMDSLRRMKDEDFKQIYEDKRLKMEIEIKQIRDVLLKSYDHSFQEQELERARDLELMRACHSRELEHEKAHQSCQAKRDQLELRLQDLKKRAQFNLN